MTRACWASLGLVSLAAFVFTRDDKPVSYAKDIQPILEDACLECHNEADPSSGLVLTSVAAMKKGGKRGAAIAPGSPDDSLMLLFIKGLREPQMPPDDPLPDDRVALIAKWIKEGAKDDAPPRPRKRPWESARPARGPR